MRNHTMRRILAAALALLCLALSLTACSNEESKQNATVVATCNGYEIKYEELRFVTMFYKDTLAATYGEGIWDDPATAETYREELETMVLKHLNENYIILTACAANLVDMTSENIDNYVTDQVNTFIKDGFDGKKSGYRKWLREHWMSESYFEFSLRVNYLESALFYTMLDNDRFEFDYDNIDEFVNYVETSPAYARTLHIYIANEDGEDPDVNLATAQRISDELQAIADPDARLKKMYEYIGSAINDDYDTVSTNGYYFTYGEMEEAYEEAAFSVEIGGVSDAFRCSGGNFVLIRLQPEADYIMYNSATLLQNYQSAALGAYEETFREVCTVELNEYGKTIDLVSMK